MHVERDETEPRKRSRSVMATSSEWYRIRERAEAAGISNSSFICPLAADLQRRPPSRMCRNARPCMQTKTDRAPMPQRHQEIPDHPNPGGEVLPEIPPRPNGKRGRIATFDPHNLHERLAKHQESVPRFISDPNVSFTNNTGEQKIRVGKVKISGSFRNRLHAEAWCRISSYLTSLAALGYNPLFAIQFALAGNAVDMIKIHNPKTRRQGRVSR